MMDYLGRRRDERFPLFTGGAPFLGFSEDWNNHFLYLPRDISEFGAGLESIGKVQYRPRENDALNLCLPFRMNNDFLDQCRLKWVRESDSGWACGGLLCHRTSLMYPLYLDTVRGTPLLAQEGGGEADAMSHVRMLVKDAYFTKKAILIYFRHLLPFFSRLSRLNAEHHKVVQDDAMGRLEQSVLKNIATLRELADWVTIVDLPTFNADRTFLHRYLDAILSEFDTEIIHYFFQAAAVPRYLRSIRISEHKLGLNHNTIVLIKHWMD